MWEGCLILKRAFVIWGKRLSQLFCLEMKKMKSQLNNRLQVYEGLFWEDSDHLSNLSKAEKESAFVEDRRSRWEANGMTTCPTFGTLSVESTHWEIIRKGGWGWWSFELFFAFMTRICCCEIKLEVQAKECQDLDIHSDSCLLVEQKRQFPCSSVSSSV